MAIHHRKDSPNGITAPNPDGPRDVVEHITKHRGMKTALTSVSEDKECIKHFGGELYCTDPDEITRDGHSFIYHSELLEQLKRRIQTTQRAEKVTASRAFQFAVRSREAIVDWQFSMGSIKLLQIYAIQEYGNLIQNDEITWIADELNGSLFASWNEFSSSVSQLVPLIHRYVIDSSQERGTFYPKDTPIDEDSYVCVDPES